MNGSFGRPILITELPEGQRRKRLASVTWGLSKGALYVLMLPEQAMAVRVWN